MPIYCFVAIAFVGNLPIIQKSGKHETISRRNEMYELNLTADSQRVEDFGAEVVAAAQKDKRDLWERINSLPSSHSRLVDAVGIKAVAVCLETDASHEALKRIAAISDECMANVSAEKFQSKVITLLARSLVR
jgi:hypothetical protein